MPTSTTLIVIPTYDEIENLETAVASVLEALPDAHVLVVDDASPDGTGELAERLAAADDRIHVLHRTVKDGLGGAYLAGFAWALEHGWTYVGEFDADGSHPATALPAMQAALESAGADLVIGSRWVRGGEVVDWPRSREALSRGGNLYARIMLGLPVHDATAGFRLYRADLLRRMDLGTVTAKGYYFQVDLTLRALDAGARIVETPIVFHERTRGASKMTRAIVAEAMARVTVTAVARVLRRAVRPRSRAVTTPGPRTQNPS